MSLAMFAAPFDDEPSQVYINNSHSENPIEKKKLTKTLKKYPSVSNTSSSGGVKSMQQQRVDFHKVNQVMQAMSNLPTQNDELGDFNPPPNPISSGVQSTIMRENMESMNNQENQSSSNVDIPNVSSNYNQNAAYNAASFEQSKHSSSRGTTSGIVNIPNYNNIYNNTPYNIPNTSAKTEDQNALIEKLNYMIHLLEEQQDERTGNVMEEVILYSFLGVFIIFIVDSFCHVGKYTR
jgi:hypothetical protein